MSLAVHTTNDPTMVTEGRKCKKKIFLIHTRKNSCGYLFKDLIFLELNYVRYILVLRNLTATDFYAI